MTVPRFVWLLLIGLICFAGVNRWQNLSEEPLIQTDGQGYYAYLPALFIYHDLQFSFVDSVVGKYYPADKLANYVIETPQGNVNKYFVGTAIVQSPFFLVGWVLSGVLGVPADGYSWPFQLMVGVAAVVALAVGLYYLGQLLLGLGVKRNLALFTLSVLVFGTNLLYYTMYEPSMSHVYTFATISAFLYFMQRVATEPRQERFLFLAALTFGLTVLIRPTNGLVLLAVPVVAGGWYATLNVMEMLTSRPFKLAVSAALVLAVVLIQPGIYLMQTGSPVVWSYQGEGFHFLRPELANVLFSYRKGLFVYCPVLLLSLVGVLGGVSAKKPWSFPLLFVLTLFTWVIASWWMWYYGGSYGHRAFIDIYPLFAIGMASAFQHGSALVRPRVAILLAALCIPLQLVQTYQYVNNIIPFDNMTKTKYWNLFLRTGEDLAFYYPGYVGQEEYAGIDSTLITHDFESDLGWGNAQQRTEQEVFSGSWSSCMNSSDQYGPTLRIKANEANETTNLVRVSAWVRSDSRSTDLSFVCALEDTLRTSYFWAKRPLRPQFVAVGEWSWCTALFRCGTAKDPTDSFVVYPMKSDSANVCFDNFEISFIRGK
ncbi:MAG: hypothetical protein EP314_07550 [Bacteroidetes bacterium]|nr:MAG: hypothetical protein EP314_07550 [Bacteroidota bacterium]